MAMTLRVQYLKLFFMNLFQIKPCGKSNCWLYQVIIWSMVRMNHIYMSVKLCQYEAGRKQNWATDLFTLTMGSLMLDIWKYRYRLWNDELHLLEVENYMVSTQTSQTDATVSILDPMLWIISINLMAAVSPVFIDHVDLGETDDSDLKEKSMTAGSIWGQNVSYFKANKWFVGNLHG